MSDFIYDQRHLYGGQTPGEVMARWMKAIEDRNAALRDRNLPTIELVHTGLSVNAVVNQGRWVALCVCGGGMGCWVENEVCACLECGRIYEASFPPEEDINAATPLLLARPMQHRNWEPLTETVEALAVENRRHLGQG